MNRSVYHDSDTRWLLRGSWRHRTLLVFAFGVGTAGVLMSTSESLQDVAPQSLQACFALLLCFYVSLRTAGYRESGPRHYHQSVERRQISREIYIVFFALGAVVAAARSCLSVSHRATDALERCEHADFVTLVIAMAFLVYVTRRPRKSARLEKPFTAL